MRNEFAAPCDSEVVDCIRGFGCARGMDDRAALFIDIEGFGQLYASEDADSLWGLTDLMKGVFLLGENAERLGATRLFAHQFGDGFLLMQDSRVRVDHVVSLGVALHQYVLAKAGHFCASAAGKGNSADVVGCYPPEVREAAEGRGSLAMGDGVMTITPVMGTALIRTYGVIKRTKGAAMSVLADCRSDLGDGIVVTELAGNHYVDWINSTNPMIAEAKKILKIESLTESELWRLFDVAVARNKSDDAWKSATRAHLRRGATLGS